jgi:prophage regulatory protein
VAEEFHMMKTGDAMKLIDLLNTGKQIRTIPKADIPGLLGEIEMLKARLWLRLTEWDDPEPIILFAKRGRNPVSPVERSTHSALSAQPPDPQGRILKFKDIAPMVRLSRSTIWRKMRDGSFPRCRKISERSVGWLDTEIHDWIANKFMTSSQLSGISG